MLTAFSTVAPNCVAAQHTINDDEHVHLYVFQNMQATCERQWFNKFNPCGLTSWQQVKVLHAPCYLVLVDNH